jgi:hypothetical protein
VKNLFRFVSEDDVLQIRGGIVWHRGKPLDKDQQAQIAELAVKLRENYLWKILSKEVQYKAAENMYYKGKTDADLLGGKAALWMLSVIQSKIEELSKL